jgi:hypothetical protein
MGNSFGFLHTSEGGFQFTVVNACKAEGIDLNQTCSLGFSQDGALLSIGNVTRGAMKPQPGIAGVGIWFAMMVFFGFIVVALTFVVLETLTRTKPYVLHLTTFRKLNLDSSVATLPPSPFFETPNPKIPSQGADAEETSSEPQGVPSFSAPQIRKLSSSALFYLALQGRASVN